MNRKLKIGMVVNLLPDEKHHGGVAYQVYNIAEKLSKQYDITIFALNKTNLEKNFNNIVVNIPGFLGKFRIFKIILFPLFIRFEDLNKFDIIHAHGDDYMLFFLKKPIIRTFHGSALGELKTASSAKRKIHQFFRYFTEYLSGFHARVTVSVSHSTKKYLPFVQRTIPNGIDLEKFKPGNKKSKNPSILFVGTIKGRKRGCFLVKVFNEEVKPKNLNAELWIVSSEKVVGDGIFWFGRVSERKLIELYQKAWVFCLPSKYEGFGVPYIEAMACGTTVVTSPNSGAKEVLNNGEYGVMSEDKFLGKAIVELLENKKVRERYVCEGLKRVKGFSWQNVVNQYVKLYKIVL